MATTLIEAVRELHAARAAAAVTKAAVDDSRKAWEAANAPLLATKKLQDEAVAAAETTVRALADAAYKANPADRKPAPGVEIKMFKTILYNAERALEWAKKAGMCLIPEQLDEKAFGKVAQATKLDFVSYGEEPKVQIATDLEKALAAAEAQV